MLPGGQVERWRRRTRPPYETLEETGLRVRVDRLLLVDGHRARDVSFVFGATVIGGELEPQLGEIAETGWLERSEIAATSPRLDLLAAIDEANGQPAYYGLPLKALGPARA